MRYITALLASFMLFSSVAGAEVYFCQGKWSSSPCDEDSRAVNLPGISRGGAGVATPVESGLDADAPAQPEGSSSGEDSVAEVKNTRLRVHGDPIWMLKKHGRSVELTAGTVNVKNVGNQDADEVRVTVVVPGVEGGEVKLDGPATIAKGATAKFTIPDNSSYFVAPSTSLYAKVYCSNCWH